MSETSIHIELEQKPETKEETSYIRPLQSANVLFKFMNRIEFLKDILLKKAILPRYYEEKIGYLEIEELEKNCISYELFLRYSFKQTCTTYGELRFVWDWFE